MLHNSKAVESSHINYTYDELKQDLLDIIRSMSLLEWQPDVVIGPCRGGLVPATMLSHYYDIPLLPLKLSLRDFKTNFTQSMEDLDNLTKLDFEKQTKILVIDDILDSGDTLDQLKEMFSMLKKFDTCDIKYATLIYNESNVKSFVPDFYSQKIDKKKNNSWIIFPWEKFWVN